jgi:hypothetical protein
MGYYDPTGQRWYTTDKEVPVNTPVYNKETGKWVSFSAPREIPATQPVENPAHGDGDSASSSGGTAGMEYPQAEVAPPANAPANVGGMIDPSSGGGSAHNLAAQLLQAQFENWQKNFQPIELAEMNQLSFNNPRVLTDAVDKARASASGMSEATGGILGRQNKAMGIQESHTQQQASRRIMDLSRAANIAGSENQARSNVAAQDQQILLGTAPNPNIVKQALNQ